MDDIDYNETGGDAWWYWDDARPRKRKAFVRNPYRCHYCKDAEDMRKKRRNTMIGLTVMYTVIIFVIISAVMLVLSWGDKELFRDTMLFHPLLDIIGGYICARAELKNYHSFDISQEGNKA